MSRKVLLIPLLAAAFLAAPAFAPATMTGLSDSALAQKPPTTNATNLNSSRSNVNRMGGGGGGKGATGKAMTGKTGKSNTGERMGGGGGGKGAAGRTKVDLENPTGSQMIFFGRRRF